MKAQKFEHEVIGTSKTFYRSQNLRVVIEGDQAKTDGKTVYLPAIDQSKDIDLAQQRVMRGYVDHEAGHGRHTDIGAWDHSGHDYKLMTYAPMLWNALEDVFIERKIIVEYPGAQKNLEAVSDAVNRIYLKKHAEDPSIAGSFEKIGALAITWAGRKALGYDPKTHDQCLATLPADILAKVEAIEVLARQHLCTMDNIQMAVTLDRDIHEAKRLTKTKRETGTEGNGPRVPTGRGDGDLEEHEEEDEAETEETGGGSEMMDPDVAGGVNGTVPKGRAAKAGYRVWTWDRDNIWHVTDNVSQTRFKDWKSAARDSGLSLYDKAQQNTRGHTSVMRRKLERALIAKSNRGWLRNREEGQLDSRKLVAAYRGEVNVHRVREPAEDMDVAVMLVVDQSGSMAGERIELAQEAAVCYAEALDRTNIPFCLTGFTTSYSPREKLNPLEDARTDSYRNYPLDLYIYKRFNEPLKQARPAIGAMVRCNMVDNADGDSLMQFYWKFLKPRDEQRKVMIVFSDGQPAARGGDQDKRLRSVVSYIESEGVELLGVGIQSNAVKMYYKKWVLVNRLEDLSKTALTELAKLLLDKNFKVDNRDLMKVDDVIRGR